MFFQLCLRCMKRDAENKGPFHLAMSDECLFAGARQISAAHWRSNGWMLRMWISNNLGGGVDVPSDG